MDYYSAFPQYNSVENLLRALGIRPLESRLGITPRKGKSTLHLWNLKFGASLEFEVWSLEFLLLALLLIRPGTSQAAALPRSTDRQISFLKDIQPILSNSCYECHGPEKQKAGLRLDQKDTALKGGDTGPLLVPGKSAESLLIEAVTGG